MLDVVVIISTDHDKRDGSYKSTMALNPTRLTMNRSMDGDGGCGGHDCGHVDDHGHGLWWPST